MSELSVFRVGGVPLDYLGTEGRGIHEGSGCELRRCEHAFGHHYHNCSYNMDRFEIVHPGHLEIESIESD